MTDDAIQKHAKTLLEYVSVCRHKRDATREWFRRHPEIPVDAWIPIMEASLVMLREMRSLPAGAAQ